MLAWYSLHQLPVTPINPVTPSINVAGTQLATIPSLSQLPDPSKTAVSIITPPHVTLEILKEAQQLGVPAVWLQPGTWDDAVIKYARGGDGYTGQVVAGGGGHGHSGWCVLVDGEQGLQAVGKL